MKETLEFILTLMNLTVEFFTPFVWFIIVPLMIIGLVLSVTKPKETKSGQVLVKRALSPFRFPFIVAALALGGPFVLLLGLSGSETADLIMVFFEIGRASCRER